MRKFHFFSLKGSWYILLVHPEDRALLESNPSAVVGEQAEGQGTDKIVALIIQAQATQVHLRLLTAQYHIGFTEIEGPAFRGLIVLGHVTVGYRSS